MSRSHVEDPVTRRDSVQRLGIGCPWSSTCNIRVSSKSEWSRSYVSGPVHRYGPIHILDVLLADKWPGSKLRAPHSQILISIHRCTRVSQIRTHLLVSPVPFTHMHSIHKSAFREQDRTLFAGSHVHTSFSSVYLIHRRANILQVLIGSHRVVV